MRKLLLSIKPKYVNLILDGSKKVEYRKKAHNDTRIEWVLIYESAPVKRVVGEFKIERVIEGTPQQIWSQTHLVGGICKQDYFKYFEGNQRAFAYQISNLIIYKTPKKLLEFGIERPPQSFRYIDMEDCDFSNLP